MMPIAFSFSILEMWTAGSRQKQRRHKGTPPKVTRSPHEAGFIYIIAIIKTPIFVLLPQTKSKYFFVFCCDNLLLLMILSLISYVR